MEHDELGMTRLRRRLSCLTHREGIATMEAASRGVVVPFHAPRGAAANARRLSAVRREPAALLGLHDDQVNADWDLLIRVASHAWPWRDPECLDTPEHARTRLRAWIDRDWARCPGVASAPARAAGDALLELVQRARPVVVQEPGERSVGEELAAGLTGRAV